MELKEYLEWKNLKPTQFAVAAGLPVPVITRFLKGQRRLAPKSIRRIVDYTQSQVTERDLINAMGL